MLYGNLVCIDLKEEKIIKDEIIIQINFHFFKEPKMFRNYVIAQKNKQLIYV